jgi:hypothetical protein
MPIDREGVWISITVGIFIAMLIIAQFAVTYSGEKDLFGW